MGQTSRCTASFTLLVTLLVAALICNLTFAPPVRANDRANDSGDSRQTDRGSQSSTATPIKHLIVIFDENNSFDHYFGTYPFATNPAGESEFHPRPDTPLVNGFTPALIDHNPNGVAPFRLDPSMAATCDNDNHYTDEQKAYDGGLLDKFSLTSSTGAACTQFIVPNLAMGYYDGNTVTALWNYAQNFAMSDNFFDTEFGTTVMGHLNLISGQTHGTTSADIAGKIVNGSIIANVQPILDDCPGVAPNITMTGKNVGDLLNAANVTWGWFYGDFGATAITAGKATCVAEYNSHYDPFQYYASTANPHHLPPSSIAAVGKSDQANHQYDFTTFWQAVHEGHLPAVSFLKPPVTETGHPSDSTPLAEQTFLVNTINELERSPYWRDMAIVIAYDDSDGWYDHVMPPIVSQSNDAANDALLGPTGLCGVPKPGAYLDRCGYGERLPFLVISPYARRNYVDHALNDTTSILRFIEDNWRLGRIGDQSFDDMAGTILGMFDFDQSRGNRDFENREVYLDPTTGERLGRW